MFETFLTFWEAGKGQGFFFLVVLKEIITMRKIDIGDPGDFLA
jgi:hypothetical protein